MYHEDDHHAYSKEIVAVVHFIPPYYEDYKP